MGGVVFILGYNYHMKTKPLTFLLAFTFLFLFSGSVYGDDLQDGMGANEREVFRSIIFSAEIVIS